MTLLCRKPNMYGLVPVDPNMVRKGADNQEDDGAERVPSGKDDLATRLRAGARRKRTTLA
jgi:hypothetical protein